MNFDFSSLEIVDSHAHPFMLTREAKKYGRRYIIANNNQGEVTDEDISNTLSYRMLLHRWTEYFGVPEDTDDEKIVAMRYERATSDYVAFVKSLFSHANITTFFNESGYPIQGARLTKEEIEGFKTTTDDLDVREVLRIEMISNHIVADAEGRLSFPAFVKAFDNTVRQRVKEGKVVALKTVIGYFSGLEIQETTSIEAEKSYYSHYYNNEKSRKAQKPFRDYMVYRAIDLCRELLLPLQIHTGAGDPPSCDLRLMNPNLLYDFLNSSRTKNIPIVLLHCGYPYCEEAAFAVNAYANVYTDVSSVTTDNSIAIERVLPVLLEKTPLTKIMYGSDGAGDVDSIWFAAVNFKDVLGRIMGDLVERKVITEKYARTAAKMILSENAKRIYKL